MPGVAVSSSFAMDTVALASVAVAATVTVLVEWGTAAA